MSCIWKCNLVKRLGGQVQLGSGSEVLLRPDDVNPLPFIWGPWRNNLIFFGCIFLPLEWGKQHDQFFLFYWSHRLLTAVLIFQTLKLDPLQRRICFSKLILTLHLFLVSLEPEIFEWAWTTACNSLTYFSCRCEKVF